MRSHLVRDKQRCERERASTFSDGGLWFLILLSKRHGGSVITECEVALTTWSMVYFHRGLRLFFHEAASRRSLVFGEWACLSRLFSAEDVGLVFVLLARSFSFYRLAAPAEREGALTAYIEREVS